MLASTAVISFLALPSRAGAEDPDRPIRMIIPFPTGGLTDILGRIVAKKLSELGGQPVVVETRQGAGGNVGMEAIARAKPDGYTIGMIITSHAINMSMPIKPGYDVTKDIAAIRILSTSKNILVVNPKVPATTVKELIALGKSYSKAELDEGWKKIDVDMSGQIDFEEFYSWYVEMGLGKQNKTAGKSAAGSSPTKRK